MQKYNRSIFSQGAVKYTDLDFSFKTVPSTGDVRKKTDEEAIKQSLMNLIYTAAGERPFRQNLYGGIRELLFEPLDQITTVILEERLKTLVDNWEPRINVISVDVSEMSNGTGLNIRMSYNVLNSNEAQNLDLIIKRNR